MIRTRLLIGLLGLILSLTALNSQAQVAIGIRGGNPNGITAKFYTSKTNAFDVILGYSYGGRERYGRDRALYGYSLTVDYQWLRATKYSELNWYFGIGGSVGRSNYRYFRNDFEDEYYQFTLLGVLGIEYVIPSSPIQLFAEFNPGVDLFPGGVYPGGGLGIRLKL